MSAVESWLFLASRLVASLRCKPFSRGSKWQILRVRDRLCMAVHVTGQFWSYALNCSPVLQILRRRKKLRLTTSLGAIFTLQCLEGSYTIRIRRYQLRLVSAFQAKSQSNICVFMLEAHGMHCWKARPFPGIPLKYRGWEARLLLLPRNSEHLYDH